MGGQMDRLSGSGWVGLHVVVAVCVLTFVPLGLGVLGRGRWLVRWWPAAAVPAVVALLLPRGAVAGLLSLPYLAATLAVPTALWRDRANAAAGLGRGWGMGFAVACLPVAAVGLVGERGGISLLGFSSGVLGLTAAHFHVAGFGALLLVSLARGPARLLAPAGVALVGLGFLVGRTALGAAAGDLVELVGAGVLSAGLWFALASRRGTGARVLFALSLVTMTLALLYAAGQLLAIPHLGLTWMVLTHGVLNAGAVLAALLVAWNDRERVDHWSHRIGHGRQRFDAASAELLGWRMHRRAGAYVTPETPDAAVGLRMVSLVGIAGLRLPEPCEVTEVVREPERTSMHYVALAGHTFKGDERFTVRLGADDQVSFEVDVRSRPVHLLARLGGPLTLLAQRVFIARCAAVLRRANAEVARL
jgi:uncharacterized protein (UPF0548 family)